MKVKSLLFAFVVLCCFLTTYTPALAQGTAFTYQGQLTGSNNPAHGTYDLTFKLWNASSGGAQVGATLTISSVVISNGLFTEILDFGSQYTTGTPYWLELGVRTNGAASFTTLSPRQDLTPTPYAITAENVDGLVSASQLTGTVPSADLSGTYSNPLDLNNAGNIFDGNGAGLAGVNALTLDGLTAANFWQLSGNAGTTAGLNFVGTTDNQPLEVHVNGQRAFRVEPDSSGYATPNVIGGAGNSVLSGMFGATIGGGGGSLGPNAVTNDFGTVAGGVANTSGSQAAIGGGYLNSASGLNATIGGGFDNSNSGEEATVGGGYENNVSGFVATVPGGYLNVASGNYSLAAGYQAQALNAGSFVWADTSGGVFTDHAANQFLIRASGGVGIGTTGSPQQFLSVHGGVNLDQANLNAGFINNGNTNGYGLTFGSGSGEGIASERIAGANQYGLDFYTSFAKRMSIYNWGGVSLNGNPLLQEPSTSGSFVNDGLYWGNGGLPGINYGPESPWLAGYLGGAVGALAPNTVCLSWDTVGDVWVSNNLSTATLTIRGGADLAEPFNISSGNGEVPQGAVVVIDEQNPGHLKLSDSPYDTHVAGVVSGANGVNPGIQMHQQGLLEGGKNVALTGRVYVQADASLAAIRPGDMLTTSSTPGYAMRVSDHARAAGAILGKAMSGLSEGKGMVLVLVTLQ